jgi:uracil-DNA glycosylase family 4
MSDTPAKEKANLYDVLSFYKEAGVDEAVDDVAPSRFAAPEIPASPNVSKSAPAARPQIAADNGSAQKGMEMTAPVASVPDEAQAAIAQEAASKAADLEALKRTLGEFDGCNLKFTAKNLVFADGNPNAKVMFVGEAPGRDEDLEGLPFVGRSGRLLDRMMAAIGLDRTNAYITNIIPWRPPGNRTPTIHETEICRPFIERHIELADPEVLVTLGGPAAKTLLNTSEGIMRLRGNWRTHVTPGGKEIPAMPTLHPAYLLRNPAHKRLAWRDFLEIKKRLREMG